MQRYDTLRDQIADSLTQSSNEGPFGCSTRHPSPPVDLELGVRHNQLYKWKEQLTRRGEGAFPGHGRGSGSIDEVARRKELESNQHSLESVCYLAVGLLSILISAKLICVC